MSSGSIILLPLLFLSALFTQSTAEGFQCTEGSTCQSLVAYKPYRDTNISSIQKLFGVKHLNSLLGANNLPAETPPGYIITEEETIKIPVPCICFKGRGVSNKMPIYTVQPGDGLFVIANTVFAGLVTYERIQDANRIPNADVIEKGQKLWIPLPCSCGGVDGESVVHYAHLVEEGSSVEELAQEYGTTNTTLYRLNGIDSDAQFIAGTPFEVPLKGQYSTMIY
ncbi:hypothetical protein Tsubulata_920750 [Turnera subulata]|uniref:LysM domain-containing protein n=1 Tax=Turnera subulata TaxID=218843 RepID=A0A9Q0J627_9ROSI|nr:hypothetical protein Tsubulata_920750 [Turnera subulata]